MAWGSERWNPKQCSCGRKIHSSYSQCYYCYRSSFPKLGGKTNSADVADYVKKGKGKPGKPGGQESSKSKQEQPPKCSHSLVVDGKLLTFDDDQDQGYQQATELYDRLRKNRAMEEEQVKAPAQRVKDLQSFISTKVNAKKGKESKLTRL